MSKTHRTASAAQTIGAAAAMLAVLIFAVGCGTSHYQSGEDQAGPTTETAGVELAEWFERTCRLANERAAFETGRADEIVPVGRGGTTIARFVSAETAQRVGMAYAQEVSLPWWYNDQPPNTNVGHYAHTESPDTEHSSGTYLPPTWVGDGAERQAVADWLSGSCEMGDPNSVALDYSADPNRAAQAETLIERHNLLETVDLSNYETHPPKKSCAGGPCPAGTIFDSPPGLCQEDQPCPADP